MKIMEGKGREIYSDARLEGYGWRVKALLLLFYLEPSLAWGRSEAYLLFLSYTQSPLDLLFSYTAEDRSRGLTEL